MVLVAIVSFFLGSWFGLALMSLLAAGANEDRQMEEETEEQKTWLK